FNPDGQPALELRDQIRRFGQVKGTGSNEQDVVGADHAELGVDGAALDQGQQVPLDTFTGNVSRRVFGAFGNFVDFINEHNAVLFHGEDGLLLDLFFIDQLGRFLFLDLAQGIGHFHFAGALTVTGYVGEDTLQLAGHFLHAGRGHDLYTYRCGLDFDIDFLVIQNAFPQLLTEHLACRGL